MSIEIAFAIWETNPVRKLFRRESVKHFVVSSERHKACDSFAAVMGLVKNKFKDTIVLERGKRFGRGRVKGFIERGLQFLRNNWHRLRDFIAQASGTFFPLVMAPSFSHGGSFSHCVE